MCLSFWQGGRGLGYRGSTVILYACIVIDTRDFGRSPVHCILLADLTFLPTTIHLAKGEESTSVSHLIPINVLPCIYK